MVSFTISKMASWVFGRLVAKNKVLRSLLCVNLSSLCVSLSSLCVSLSSLCQPIFSMCQPIFSVSAYLLYVSAYLLYVSAYLLYVLLSMCQPLGSVIQHSVHVQFHLLCFSLCAAGLVSFAMCFRYELYESPDQQFGGINETGHWTGMVGEVYRGVSWLKSFLILFHTYVYSGDLY